jgi:hypothetical protein
MLVKYSSALWNQLLEDLQYSKLKSNKDVICTSCWKVFNYEEARHHKVQEPEHVRTILTSKYFASEGVFIDLAKENKKIFRSNGDILVINPYFQKKGKRQEKELSKKPRLVEEV